MRAQRLFSPGGAVVDRVSADHELADALLSRAGIEIEPAPKAQACSALGCRETTQLLRAVIDGFGIRVLCADHLAGLIRREVLEND